MVGTAVMGIPLSPGLRWNAWLNVPRFTGKENADEFLEWVEQCDQIFRIHNLSDQRRVNLHQLNSMDML
jgi:hypothetical protein